MQLTEFAPERAEALRESLVECHLAGSGTLEAK